MRLPAIPVYLILVEQSAGELGLAADTDIKIMLMDLKSNFCSTDIKTDHHTAHMDLMEDHLAKLCDRITESAYWISDLPHGPHKLKTVSEKNEDLEFRSPMNNVCTVRLLECSDLRKPEAFVESLLDNLLRIANLLDLLFVERT
ncbi:hypothetical protein NDU88_001620 [Pleurodeles waltl]|uniref:Uncharacterized protein n=1 Tax=Pleurodeles waltl TaxID=8319 RepID=A0AAV7LY53_PLEWA|nr:hypothetical protein NDU88_001620 [Pleurodeles waltl]